MLLTVWLQNGKRLEKPKIVSVKHYTVADIAEAYFGEQYKHNGRHHGAFTGSPDCEHAVIYTEPEKIGNGGSGFVWLFFPLNKRQERTMKKLYQVEPLPSHERSRLSVEGAR